MFREVLFDELGKVFGMTPVDLSPGISLTGGWLYVDYKDIDVTVKVEESIYFEVIFDVIANTDRKSVGFGFLSAAMANHATKTPAAHEEIIDLSRGNFAPPLIPLSGKAEAFGTAKRKFKLYTNEKGERPEWRSSNTLSIAKELIFTCTIEYNPTREAIAKIKFIEGQ